MEEVINKALLVGAALSALAALLHVAIIFGGAPWYRFFGAGESMARMAEAGRLRPTLITLGIASVLALWSVYALSGAGLIAPLPLLRNGLCLITGIYLLRGLAILPLLTVARAHSTPFLIWSSLVCLGFGLVHLLGLAQRWNSL
ncbi:hypothetical protein LNN38_15605 [Pseudomonas sp. LA21]|uniref:hypothetical protein n=1 Tax=unclassified Pseudomonas TaxID=196821 RepID=UPI001FB694F9|nr:hypothetical protein [Pseudomonas sp. LA21]MCJ1886282.1 hypothetical protein [Pseudomonas sp. LA21]